MSVKIGLATLKQECRLDIARGLYFHRKEIPVYLPPHRDPEISPQGANEHYHIAWNRASIRFRHRRSGIVVLFASQVKSVRIPKRPPKICSAPCSMHRTDFPELKVWKEKHGLK
ncbi:MAG TPA: hypothetical protein VFV82_06120 [Candidatus Binatia bacterium]|nr:hypothetical protein [Candidatus Binatia bacterium]